MSSGQTESLCFMYFVVIVFRRVEPQTFSDCLYKTKDDME